MKIGLALSSGGVLGAAHIGVIECLEKNNIKIDLISGTSAGAIVGLLYAAGGTEAINTFFDQINSTGIFRPRNIIRSPHTNKLFEQIENLLRETVKVDNFSDLKIPFSCVATDLATGKEKIFTSGDPVKCVMASAAYPGVFPIQIIDEQSYIDGAVKLNLPVTPLKKQGADFIIASSIYSLNKMDPTKKISRVQIASRALEIMEYQLSEYQLKKADFTFQPPVGSYNWYNFDQIKKISNLGKKYANRRIIKLLATINSNQLETKNKLALTCNA